MVRRLCFTISYLNNFFVDQRPKKQFISNSNNLFHFNFYQLFLSKKKYLINWRWEFVVISHYVILIGTGAYLSLYFLQTGQQVFGPLSGNASLSWHFLQYIPVQSNRQVAQHAPVGLGISSGLQYRVGLTHKTFEQSRFVHSEQHCPKSRNFPPFGHFAGKLGHLTELKINFVNFFCVKTRN